MISRWSLRVNVARLAPGSDRERAYASQGPQRHLGLLGAVGGMELLTSLAKGHHRQHREVSYGLGGHSVPRTPASIVLS